jgi:hypothetical protein
MENRVLFISGRCPYSKKILLGIHQHKFLKEIFKIINIDNHPYPNYITTVPCILANNQVVKGDNVFEYLGKIVEAKMAQEERESTNQLKDSDQGVCSINEDGELEGYCGDSVGVGVSSISDENDDFTHKRHGVSPKYDILDGVESSNTVYTQVKEMEGGDNQLSRKRQTFDSDYERLQSERGEHTQGLGRGVMGPS